VSTIPSQFRAGDFVSWVEDEAPAGTTAIRAYLRTNAASGAVLDATANGNDWAFRVSAATSATLTAGTYLAQFVAIVATNPVSYREARFTVLPSLAFTGSPTAIETRSKLKIRYDEIQEAIRIVTTSAQEYQIGVGGGGRKVRRADLPELRKERDEIRAQLTAEERASDLANGRGDPDALYTRFTPSY
jgi:hypothetical protein